MKSKVCLLVVVVIALSVVPVYSWASSVFKTQGVTGQPEWTGFDFWLEPSEYEAKITDLSYGNFGLEGLSMSISTVNDVKGFHNVGSVDGEGFFTFSVETGNTYFANIFAGGTGKWTAGIFGFQVQSVHTEPISSSPAPVPTSLLLLGSGLMGMAGLRKKFRK